MATTSCRSCSATALRHALTSRQTGRARYCGCKQRTASRACQRGSPKRWRMNCGCWPSGSVCTTWRCGQPATWRARLPEPCASDRRLRQVGFPGDLDGLETVADVHLFEKLRDIVLDGTNGETETVGDFLVGKPLGDVRKDLLLAVAERRL